jgi:hypothetical protein
MSLTAPENSAVPVAHSIPRRYVALGLIVVAIILLGALVLIRHNNPAVGPVAAEQFTPAPTSLITAISHLPAQTVDTVGVTAPSTTITPPAQTQNPALWVKDSSSVDALPVVFFYGAEFAPYAGAERWPLLVALSRFGTFTNVGLMQTSGSVAFSGVSTFTFSHTHYASRWLDLQTVERYSAFNPAGVTYTSLQRPTARQATAVAAYDTSATSFPLLDIADRYVLAGSSFPPSVLGSLNQADIAADLAFPGNAVTQAVVAAANEITAAICSVTGQMPATVCDAKGVVAADVKMGIHTGA